MTWEIRGKVVLITGASAGIGRAAALAFDEAGARVAMAARRAERLEENAARMTDAHVLAVDIADPAQAERMVEETIARYGRLDVLVNNAGETRIEHTEDLDVDEFIRLLNVNFLGAVVATNRAAKQMRRQGGGHIVNVASPAALLGVPFNGTYSATKGAMCGWTRVMQAEWAHTGITVTEYHPGLIATEMADAARSGAGIGRIVEDAFDEPGRLGRLMPRPLPPETAAATIVDAVRHRRQVAYSTRGQAVLMTLASVPRLRRLMGKQMAATMRKQLGIAPWSGEQVER